MGYDLYFLREREKGPLQAENVVDYFKQRPHYQVDPASKRAFYGNEHTGVYFGFELESPEEELAEEEVEPSIDDGLVPAGLAFNVNFFRPHVFGLEAEPELTAFVRHFDLAVEDPQLQGMGRGAYAPEGFLKGWDAGNRMAYRVAVSRGLDKSLTSLPSAEVQRIWRWNLHSAVLQAELGEQVFVPHINCATLNDRVMTYVVWGDAMPIALPPVDFVLVVRQALSKPRLLRLLGTKTEVYSASWADVSELLGQAQKKSLPDAGDYWLFNTASAYQQAEAFFLRDHAPAPALERVSMDHLLNQELLAAAKAGQAKPD